MTSCGCLLPSVEIRRHWVAQARRLGADGALSRYQVSLVPWTWFLTQRTDCRVFQEKTVLEIIEAIFSSYRPRAAWQLAEQIDEIDSSLLHGLRACGRRTLVRERLARGRGQVLSQTDDLALYCALSLLLPDGFEKIEPFANALAATRAGSRRFGEYLDKIPAEQWDVTDKLLNTL